MNRLLPSPRGKHRLPPLATTALMMLGWLAVIAIAWGVTAGYRASDFIAPILILACVVSQFAPAGVEYFANLRLNGSGVLRHWDSNQFVKVGLD